jgi:hypothetical protein
MDPSVHLGNPVVHGRFRVYHEKLVSGSSVCVCVYTNSDSSQTVIKQPNPHIYIASDARILVFIWFFSLNVTEFLYTSSGLAQLFCLLRGLQDFCREPITFARADRHASERTNFILEQLIPVISFITGLATPKPRSQNCVSVSLKLASTLNRSSLQIIIIIDKEHGLLSYRYILFYCCGLNSIS